MENLSEALYFTLDCLLGLMILFIFLWFINRKRLLNVWGLLLASLGIGLSFSTVIFLGTYIDTKYISWDFTKRLSTSLNVFIWAFGGSLICILLAIKISMMQGKVNNNDDKV